MGLGEMGQNPFDTYRNLRIEIYNGIVRFPCDTTAFLLAFACRLQQIICQKVMSTTRKTSQIA